MKETRGVTFGFAAPLQSTLRPFFFHWAETSKRSWLWPEPCNGAQREQKCCKEEISFRCPTQQFGMKGYHVSV